MQLERRPLGGTGHRSPVLVFGGAALAPLSPPDAERAAEDALARGVDHFDVAPSYGDAELRLAPTLARHRRRIFLACKTRERRARGAREELQRSLERLGVDHFDLYQCHAVSSRLDLDQLLGPRGAIEAFEAAREEGLLRHIGITGHHCGVLEEALRRYPFDSVMFPLNPAQAADDRPPLNYARLLATAGERGVGTLAIKAVARGPWRNGVRRAYTTWYEPVDDAAEVALRVRYALSHPVTALVLPSDTRLWAAIFAAAAAFEPLSAAERQGLTAAGRDQPPLFVESWVPSFQAYGVPRGG